MHADSKQFAFDADAEVGRRIAVESEVGVDKRKAQAMMSRSMDCCSQDDTDSQQVDCKRVDCRLEHLFDRTQSSVESEGVRRKLDNRIDRRCSESCK